MNSDIEEQIFSINTKVERLVDIENKIEKLLNEKSEVSQMNSKDREVILNEIKVFQTEFSEGLKVVFQNNQAEFRKDKIALLQQGQQSVNDSLLKLQNLLIDFQGTADSCKELKKVCKDTIIQTLNVDSMIQELKREINTTVKTVVEKEVSALNKSVKAVNEATDRINVLFKKSVSLNSFIWFMAFLIIAFLLGIFVHRSIMQITCENVFDQFYSERYEKEIAEPLKTAQKEADKYLSDTKKQADEDLKNKKAEAKKYLDDQMAEARTKAQEEYDKRMELYSQQVQAAVDKKIKKEKSKPMEGN